MNTQEMKLVLIILWINPRILSFLCDYVFLVYELTYFYYTQLVLLKECEWFDVYYMFDADGEIRAENGHILSSRNVHFVQPLCITQARLSQVYVHYAHYYVHF